MMLNVFIKMTRREGFHVRNIEDIGLLFADYMRLYYRTMKSPNSSAEIFRFLKISRLKNTIDDIVTSRPKEREFLFGIYRIQRIEHLLRTWLRLQSLTHTINLDMILIGFSICERDSCISGLEAWEMYRRFTREMPFIERIRKSPFLRKFVLLRSRKLEFNNFVNWPDVLDAFSLFACSFV